jgi:predicted N-formylglutamate amidohydrolase
MLLGPGEPAPCRMTNPAGQSSFLLIGDHAGNRVPRSLAQLGLDEAELARHIGLDIGVAQLGRQLGGLLDACFIEQSYSRLVVDCNRHADAADAMPALSDGTEVPGNRRLTTEGRAMRLAEIYQPYHAAISETLAQRDRDGRDSVLIALHSFTPVMAGVPRPWDVGVLYDGGETVFARAVLAALLEQPGLCVGDNEPYRMDATDYTVPRHAYPGSRRYVEIEVSQGRLAEDSGIAAMTKLLAQVLGRALDGGKA